MEIPYPLLTGAARTGLTVAAVAAFATACLAHAYSVGGPRFAGAAFAATAGVGWVFEFVGVHTGVPFGSYAYGAGLGPRLAGVPLLVPLAWTMLGYPSYLAAERLTTHWWSGAALGAATMAGWDLFLDPQLLAAGAWRWAGPPPTWPGSLGVPLANTGGWLAAGLVVTGALLLASRLAAIPAGRDAVPLGLLCWAYASDLMANLVFFHRPLVALWGGLGMAPVVFGLALQRAHRTAARQPR